PVRRRRIRRAGEDRGGRERARPARRLVGTLRPRLVSGQALGARRTNGREQALGTLLDRIVRHDDRAGGRTETYAADTLKPAEEGRETAGHPVEDLRLVQTAPRPPPNA